MPGIYWIQVPNGKGYIGQTTMSETVYRIVDHVINSYCLPNYFTRGGSQADGDNAAGLQKYIRARGAHNLHFFMNDDKGDAYGFGAESFNLCKQFWKGKDTALDMMELACIYKGKEMGGVEYNTEEGGQANLVYIPRIMCNFLTKHFKDKGLRDKTSASLIKAIKESDLNFPTKKEGLQEIFDAEYKILRKAWSVSNLTDIFFSTATILQILGKNSKKEVVLRASKIKKTQADIIYNEAKIKQEVFKVLDELVIGLNSLDEINTTDTKQWLRFDYFSVECIVDKERFWESFWPQAQSLFEFYAEKTQYGTAIYGKFRKQITISDLSFKLTFKKIKQNLEPYWIQEVKWPTQDVTDLTKHAFITNFAQFINEVRGKAEQSTTDELKKDQDLRDIVHDYVKVGYIARDYDIFYDSILEATYGLQFGNLVFEPITYKDGTIARWRSGKEKYGMKREASEGYWAYVTQDEVKEMLNFATSELFW